MGDRPQAAPTTRIELTHEDLLQALKKLGWTFPKDAVVVFHMHVPLTEGYVDWTDTNLAVDRDAPLHATIVFSETEKG